MTSKWMCESLIFRSSFDVVLIAPFKHADIARAAAPAGDRAQADRWDVHLPRPRAAKAAAANHRASLDRAGRCGGRV